MRYLCLIALAVLMTGAEPTVEDPGLLLNAGFEAAGKSGDASAADWRFPTDPKDALTRSADAARTGKWSLLSVDDGSKGSLWPNATQVLKLEADAVGQRIKLWAWAMTPAADHLTDGSAMLKLEFLDEKAKPIGKHKEGAFLDRNSPRDKWIRGEVSSVIPEGTRTVRVQLMHNWGGKEKAGRVYFDDAGLQVQ